MAYQTPESQKGAFAAVKAHVKARSPVVQPVQPARHELELKFVYLQAINDLQERQIKSQVTAHV